MSGTILVRRVLPIALICLVSAFVLFRYCDFTGESGEADQIRTIATVMETISPEWLPESVTYKRQQKIGPGRIAFQKGTVQLKMDNDVTLILESPCDFILYETGKSFCNYGKISAHVPPSGTGFEITSPQGRVVDRGTDFFLNVTPQQSQLEVIQGKVELDSMAGKLHTLTTGKAMTFQKNEKARASTFGGKFYVTRERFHSQLTDYVSSLLEKKTAIDSVLDNTANLLVRFDLQKSPSGSLPNLSRIGNKRCPNAIIEGCQNSEGALYGTQGINFSKKSDRIVFAPGQTVSSMTMVASVRVDHRLQLGNVLCSSKPQNDDPGTILWQVSNLGFMQIQISPKSKDNLPCYNSSEFLFPGTQETWYTLAVVLDARRRNITFYSDGKRISSVPWYNPLPIKLEKMTLGNVLYNSMDTERQLNGVMDRFYIFNRALTKDEIKELVW